MLSNDVTRYVAVYQALGLNFSEQSRTLHLYARYAEAYDDRFTLVSRIRDWCSTASSPIRARSCYDTARRFCVFMNAEDSRHEVPPAGAFGRGFHLSQDAVQRGAIEQAAVGDYRGDLLRVVNVV